MTFAKDNAAVGAFNRWTIMDFGFVTVVDDV